MSTFSRIARDTRGLVVVLVAIGQSTGLIN